MGDQADMMVDGTVCEGCGVIFGDGESPGYPRRCPACERFGSVPHIKPKQKSSPIPIEIKNKIIAGFMTGWDLKITNRKTGVRKTRIESILREELNRLSAMLPKDQEPGA